MQTTTDITVLDRLLVVNLDVHIWSAKKKLLPQDFGNASLPPEELASLGCKRVCNPEDLKTFGTLKARATTMLERIGIRFLNGWTVPTEKQEEIDNGLAAIKDEFNAAKHDFLLRYENSVQEWIASHPGWEEIITNSIVSEDYVRSRLDFRWQVYRVIMPEKGNTVQDSLESDVMALGDTLYGEISKFATETWKNCYEGKLEITRKALSPLKTMYDKLIGLTFIEPRVSPIANLINTALTSIPQRGPITGGTLLMLQGLVSLLRTPADIVAHGQKILDGQSADAVLASVTLPKMTAPDMAIPVIQDDCPLPMPGDAPALESCGLW